MSRYDFDDDQPYVVIERRSESGVGAFLLGIAVGAGARQATTYTAIR